ncbi:MAG: hypothetical protein JW384_02368 [Nitrosomonadaceae bacterium]|nr:hypothetical protein [Nitrosomonadaceae bacterium]
MSNKQSSGKSLKVASSSVSEVLGITPVLPGESMEVYQRGLLATIQELGATTPLQIYLAEKIYECLWWMRRYENQKRATLIHSMAGLLDPNHFSKAVSDAAAWAMEALFSNRIDDEFTKVLDGHNLTMESLTQKALEICQFKLESLDEMIALKAKTLAGFQASYEALVNRSVLQERLKLQNDLLRRDLQTIDVSALEKPAKAYDKPQTKSGQ